jgi:hypothetical protein
MKIEQIKVSDLLPYINNARRHPEAQIAQLAASIKEFGFNNPILIGDDLTIIAGHGRFDAAKRLGLTEVPCIKVSHLTPTQRKAYILADNKLALNAEWDIELLNLELDHLQENGFDIEFTGFTDTDLQKIRDDLDQASLLQMSDGAEQDNPAQPKEKNSEFYPLSVLVEHDQRNDIFAAIKKAKEKHSLDNSGDAIWSICKEWMVDESI